MDTTLGQRFVRSMGTTSHRELYLLEFESNSNSPGQLPLREELVKQVERTVRSENYRSPNRPIYLVGESLGGCLALAVAARNPDIDLILILANPGIPLRMVMATVEKGLPLQQTVGEISQGIITLSSYLSVLADILRGEILLWKLKMLRSAAAYVNSRLHAVKAQALILSSGKDQFLPSQEEGERLHHILPCEIRKFDGSGHALFLEDGVDLVTIIKGASFYRRARFLNYALDYFPPSPSEFKKIYESCRLIEVATTPVMLSTLENGKIVKGLAGIPSEGPVLFVGYHMLLALEVIHLISSLWSERNILVRGIAHPMLFMRLKDGKLPDVSTFDLLRIMGAVPVSATNFYGLLSSKSHVLLYPGGMREALHQKGEEYKLFWSERTDIDGEVAKQDPHLPLILPKLLGRFYYLFGKPIVTEGRKQELKDREKTHELYLEVKSKVERCIAYLKEKRENDPYRIYCLG
ncbi:hypothetical protein ACSBR1_010998 [Camellia fascicularis]